MPRSYRSNFSFSRGFLIAKEGMDGPERIKEGMDGPEYIARKMRGEE